MPHESGFIVNVERVFISLLCFLNN